MTEPLLNEDELNALMTGAEPSDILQSMLDKLPPYPQPDHVEVMEWGIDVISLHQDQTLVMLDDKMAAMLSEHWTAVARRDVTVFFKDHNETSFLEAMDAHDGHVVFSYEIGILGSIKVSASIELVAAYVDILLGGDGRTANTENLLSFIETRLSQKLADNLARVIEQLWRVIIPDFGVIRYVRMYRDTMDLMLNPEDYPVASVGYVVVLSDDIRGDVYFHYDRRSLASLLKKHHESTSDGIERRYSLETGQNIPMKMTLNLASCKMHVRDLLSLQPGDILPLSVPQGDPLTFSVKGKPLFLAKPGSLKGQIAAEIIERLEHD
ncbi:MAG: FliM/FliN family flagellar motor switch protein [Zetaproteobacteria bacterium]|nr:FliM/FliN family flagellar motor switch protein [Zetaproteobacteria bacterium]